MMLPMMFPKPKQAVTCRAFLLETAPGAAMALWKNCMPADSSCSRRVAIGVVSVNSASTTAKYFRSCVSCCMYHKAALSDVSY